MRSSQLKLKLKSLSTTTKLKENPSEFNQINKKYFHSFNMFNLCLIPPSLVQIFVSVFKSSEIHDIIKIT